MDSSTLMNTVILVLLFIIPIVWLKQKRKNRERLLLQPLVSLAERSASKINEHDIWNNSVIGIDTKTHKLFRIREAEGNQIQQEINLSEVQKCKLNNVSKTVNTPDGKQTMIEKLELIFTYHDQSRSESHLEFYNSKLDNISINEEFRLTAKWLEIINIELLTINAKK